MMLYKNKSINGVSSNADGQVFPIVPAIAVLSINIPELGEEPQKVDIIPDASMIRIFSKDNPIFIRFKNEIQEDDVSTSTFDEYVPAGQMIDIGIPADGFNPTSISIMAETETGCIIIQK